MSIRSSFGWLTAAVPISLLVGASGGYLLHTHQSKDHVAQLEQEVRQLKKEAVHPSIDRPSNEEATSAIAKTGRSFDISECKPRQAVPGVTCTGTVTTTSGSFAGTKQPGMLSFAKIDGRWEQMQ